MPIYYTPMTDKSNISMEKIVSLSKRRGFIFPSSEIYGGFSGIYDFGPNGTELAHNLKTLWWKDMVQKNSNIVGLNSAIFMSPKVWVASGHVDGFSDPLVRCNNCGTTIRIEDDSKDKLKCEKCGKTGFSKPENFNLLVESNLGNIKGDSDDKSYLRGETAQGIYVNYKSVLDSMHLKIPFGIAQIGKAFRNEVSARQFIYRTREFEQMEMQYFTHGDHEDEEYEKLKKMRMEWFISLGFKKENLRFKKHDKLIFYAKKAEDIEYKFPFGWGEVEGIHARSDYDLTKHTEKSGIDLSYMDEAKNEKYIPHIVESSIGVGRLFLALLCESYREENVDGEMRVVLKLKPSIAPVKIAILPLSNKDELIKGAKDIYKTLNGSFTCQYDQTQSIGKRYRRQDEIGTPYCITYDFDSIKDKKVTIRERDSMSQERIEISDLGNYFSNKF